MTTETPLVKNTLHVGQKYIPITDGCKVHFHFQTWKLGKQKILIDDSRMIGKKEPMVLVIGHKFKLEVWESIVKLMAVGEVASFKVNKALLQSYPIVSKTIRELNQEEHTKRHSCAMSLHTDGIGYPDLDDLIRMPSDLEFVIELLQVERAEEYDKEIWQLTAEEKLELLPELREKGNMLYKQKLYDEAEEAYKQAIGICEEFMLRERKSDPEWTNINETKMPLLLNYVQCQLIKGDYYSVIKHCGTVLEHDKDNQKALYRRAKAHVGAWNPDLAEKDFKRLKTLNPAMTATVNRELENIRKLRKEKEEYDRNAMKNLFLFSSSGPT